MRMQLFARQGSSRRGLPGLVAAMVAGTRRSSRPRGLPALVAGVCVLLASIAAFLGPLTGTAVAAGAGGGLSGQVAPLARERAIQVVTGLQNASQVIEKPVCPPSTAGRYACAARALYDTGTKGYVHPDLARPRLHTPAAAMTVPTGGLGARRAVAPFSPAPPGASLPAAAPTGQGAPAAGTPAYLQQAYDLTALAANAGSGDKVAIVDAYVDSEAESDLRVYRATFGLPACEQKNGCFTQDNENGEPVSPETCEPGGECEGWQMETSLDLEAVSALCPNCSIALVEGRNAGPEALGAAEEEAYKLGANQVSDSWSGPEKLGLAARHAQVATVGASGDRGQWAIRGNLAAAFPAGEDAVTAVGGTDLLAPRVAGSPATRGFQETVWFEKKAEGRIAGTGSGCTSEAKPSSLEPEPPWQHQTVCPSRAANDISADADPATGLLVYDRAAGGGLVVGGTSLATPLTAAYYALVGHGAGDGSGEWDYTNAALLNDVVSGSNGSCGTLICMAGPGYDGPTGNGSISGDAVTGAPGVAGPSQVTGSYGTCVSANSVALSGGVYENGLPTEYWWEYGPTTAYGQQTQAASVGETAPAPGSGGVWTVGAAIGGLSAAATYHYRLVARNADGTTYGYDFQFTTGAPGQPETAAPPAVTGAPTAKASINTAAITAQVAPGNDEVAYTVQFGTSTAYGTETAVQHLPAGCAGVSAPAQLEGLQPATIYHVKLIATSAAGKAESADTTFTTEAQPPPPPPAPPTPAPPTAAPPAQAPAPAPEPATAAAAAARPAEGGQAPRPATGTTTLPAATPAQRTAQQPLARIAKVKVSAKRLIVTAGRPAGGSSALVLLLELTRHGKVLKTVRLTLPAGASKTVGLKLPPALAALRRHAKRFTVQLVLREAPAHKHGRAGQILARRIVSVR